MNVLHPRRIPFVAVAAALVFSASVHAGEMFFTDRGASILRTAELDGSGLQSLIPSAGSNIRGVAIDTSRNDLFYADNGANIIYRSRLDGTGRVAIIDTGLDFPADIATHTEETKLYWCDRNNNRIERANYDGTGRETLIDGIVQPYYLDLDLVNGKLYWGDFSGGNIFRADLADGANVETMIDTNIQTRGVKVDPICGYFYWCDREAHKVQRRKIDGGPIEDLYTGLDTPHGMTLDIFAGKVYWVSTGTNGVAGSKGARAVNRGDMDGSGPHEVLADVTQPWDITLDTDTESYVEWVLRHFPKDSPAMITDPQADPEGDGNQNAVEYLTLSKPMATGDPPAIWFEEFSPGVRRLTHVSAATNISDAVTSVELSSDLRTWVDGRPFLQTLGRGFTADPAYVGKLGIAIIDVHEIQPPFSDAPRGTYARLRVEIRNP